MTTEQKTAIAGHAAAYIVTKGLTGQKFATLTNVNNSYVSNILNKVFQVNGVDIPDKYFRQIAKVIGYAVEKTYWPHVETREHKELMVAMKLAKQTHGVRTLIVETGAGKTYAVDTFKKTNPLHTYVVTMHSLMKIGEMFRVLAKQLGLPNKGTKAQMRTEIIDKLKDIKVDGGYPVVIIDEGENMTPDMMKMIKGFYDAILNYAGIVMIGTNQLWEIMQAAMERDKQGGPQYYRRFKAGTITIKPLVKRDDRFKPFFDELGIEDPSFRKLLCKTCDNYGELHDYLEPALRIADNKGEELNERLFRMLYNIKDAA